MGRSSRCKGCVRIYVEATREQINARQLALYHIKQEPKREQKKLALERLLERPSKRCCRCKVEKPKSEFTADKTRRDGLKPRCRSCRSIEFSENVARSGRNKKSDQWKSRFPERERQIARKHRAKPHNRIHHAISARIYLMFGGKRGRRTLDFLDYSIDELMSHLERQFLKGMSWENYGEWHVDHILPLCSFTIQSIEDPDIKRAWGLANLRPLWGKDNARKNGKRTFLI